MVGTSPEPVNEVPLFGGNVALLGRHLVNVLTTVAIVDCCHRTYGKQTKCAHDVFLCIVQIKQQNIRVAAASKVPADRSQLRRDTRVRHRIEPLSVGPPLAITPF